MGALTSTVAWMAIFCGLAAGPYGRMGAEDRLAAQFVLSSRVGVRLAALADRRLPWVAVYDGLHDPDVRVRRATLRRILRYAWGHPPPDVPLELVGDPDPGLRREAIESLAGHQFTRAAYDALWRALDDSNEAVRAAALVRLRAVLPKEAEVWLDDRATNERALRAMLAMVAGGPAAWAKSAAHADPLVRRTAIWKLSHALSCGCRAWHDDVTPEHVTALVTALRDPDARTRRTATVAIARLWGPKARALPIGQIRALLPQLVLDPDATVRASAIQALAEHGEPSTRTPMLVRAVSDAAKDVRVAALEALQQVRARGPSVAAALGEAMDDAEDSVRYHAHKALGAMGEDAKWLIPRLLQHVEDSNRDPYERGHALEALSKIGIPDRATLARILPLLDDEDLEGDARYAIDRLKPENTWATPQLAAILARAGKDAKDAHASALLALARIGPAATAVLPSVRALAAGSADAAVRANATMALTIIESERPLDELELELVLRDRDWGAGSSPYTVVPPSRRATPDQLVSALGHPRVEIRRWAITRLAWSKDETVAHVPALIDRLHDEDDEVRNLAVCTLKRLGPKARSAIPVLLALMTLDARALPTPCPRSSGKRKVPNTEREARTRLTSFLSLVRKIGSLPASASPLLRRLFEADVDGAADALVSIGEPALAVLPVDIAAVPPKIRRRWLNLFARFGPVAIPRIRAGLHDASPRVRRSTVSLLGGFGEKATHLADRIVPLLRDRHATIRAGAALALGAMRANADVAEPALRAALKDPFGFVRVAAKKALPRLRQRATSKR